MGIAYCFIRSKETDNLLRLQDGEEQSKEEAKEE